MADERVNKSIISELQDLVAARIAGLDYFAGPPVVEPLTEQVSQLRNKMDMALKRMGLSIFVATPKVTGTANRRFGLKLSVIVSELVSVNQAKVGTQIAAADAALAVSMALAWADLEEGETEARRWHPADWWEPFVNIGWELQQLDPLVIYEVTAETAVYLKMYNRKGS
jgi:hypothetical protein